MNRSFSQIQLPQGGVVATSTPNASESRKAVFFMVLLAIQFGLQPNLTRTYTSKETIKATVILVQEILKFGLAGIMLFLSGGGIAKAVPSDWSIVQWLSVAGIPAMLYSLQNICSLTAYQHLDGLTYNVLNQTKTLSAAFCCYLVMGQRQSRFQVVALFMLLLSALTMEGIVGNLILRLLMINEENDGTSAEDIAKHWTLGVLPLLAASFISGLAGALCQRLLQAAGGGRNPYLFSMELCAASVLCLLVSLAVSGEGERIMKEGFLNGWTVQTMIPIFTNSIGGILVGLVTKFAGSVRKGFALIFGIFLSGVIQARSTPGGTLSTNQLLGGLLAGLALWMHATNKPKPKSVPIKKKEN